MPRENDPRSLRNARGADDRGLAPQNNMVQYAQNSQTVPPAPPGRPAEGQTLILAGPGVRSSGTVSIQPPPDNRNRNPPPVYAKYTIPDLRQLSGYKDAAPVFLARISGEPIRNPKVVFVNTPNEVIDTIARYGTGARAILWFGHMHTALNATTGKMESTALQLEGNQTLPRNDFINLTKSKNAKPEIFGCYGSEGAGQATGASGYLSLGLNLDFDSKAIAKARAAKPLVSADLKIITIFEQEKSDIEQFLETIPIR